MGKGTIAFNAKPHHSKLYGSADFYIRPIYYSKIADEDVYFIAIRPVLDSDSYDDKTLIVELEGEWNMGENSYRSEKSDIANGEYQNVCYVYYHEEFVKASLKQQTIMKTWATHGAIDLLSTKTK